MIEVFKILHNYYDSEVAPKLTLNNASVTRGNSLKLLNQSFHYDLRKYSFLLVWLISGTVYLMLLSWHLLLIHLKIDLIGSGGNQDVKYDYTAELTGAAEADLSFIRNKI